MTLKDQPQNPLEFTDMILLPFIVLWVRRPMRFAAGTRWSLLAIFAFAFIFAAPECAGVDPSDDGVRISGIYTEKHREGTRIANVVGNFRESGNRWTFLSDSGEFAYRVLENQSLERIAKAIQEDPLDHHWKISGTLTEFLDENFLLVHRIERAPRVDL